MTGRSLPESPAPETSAREGGRERGGTLFFVSTLDVGGAERQTVDLRSHLRNRGHTTHLLVHERSRSEAILQRDGAEAAVFINAKGMSDLRGWVRVWREIRRCNPDVIFAVNQTPLIVAVLMRLARATKAKIVCVFHTTVLEKSEQKRLFLFRLALKAADTLVFVGANQKAFWEKRGLACRQTLVIPNGVDFSRFDVNTSDGAEVRRKMGLVESDFVIGLVAAFRPVKNHIALVDAIAEMHRRGIPAKALMVGDGPTRPHVLRRAQELGVAQHVLFAGEQKDVRPWIAASNVGVLCSHSETFPLAALEFLATGVPFVMPTVGGAPEIVQHGTNGFLYEPGQECGLVDSLMRLADPSLRRQFASRARASVVHFSVGNMVDRYEAIQGLSSASRPPETPASRSKPLAV